MSENQSDLIEFTGFQSPNYTIVPDELFDQLLAILSGAEIKVLLYVVRRTFGFKKESDSISFNQICNGIKRGDGQIVDRGTGLSMSTAQVAVKGLVDRKIILAIRKRSIERGDEATTYQLNVVTSESEAALPPVTENRYGGLPKIDNPRYRKSVTQYTGLQETERQTSNIREIKSEAGEDSATLTRTRPKSSSGFQLIGRLIPRSIKETGPGPGGDETRQVIRQYVADLADQLGDEAKLSVSTARVFNLYRKSGLKMGRFLGVLMEARSRTKEVSGKIKKRQAGPGDQVGRKNQFPYFVAVVEDLLGLRSPDRPHTNPIGLDAA
jgi:hypothetical protein